MDRAWPFGNLFSLKRWFIAVNDGWKKRPNENIFLNWWYMKFLVLFILISRIRIKNDQKKTRPAGPADNHLLPEQLLDSQKDQSPACWTSRHASPTWKVGNSPKQNTKLRSNHVFFFLILGLDHQGFSGGCIQTQKKQIRSHVFVDKDPGSPPTFHGNPVFLH